MVEVNHGLTHAVGPVAVVDVQQRTFLIGSLLLYEGVELVNIYLIDSNQIVKINGWTFESESVSHPGGCSLVSADIGHICILTLQIYNS